MGTRGRESAASLAVVGTVEVVPRPQAPSDLTDEQAAEWCAIVNRLPADWFPRETHATLAQYCRHVIRARRLADLIDKVEASEQFDLKEYRDLLASEEMQSRAMSSLATRMRITQQATFDKERKKPGPSRKLWERSGG